MKITKDYLHEVFRIIIECNRKLTKYDFAVHIGLLSYKSPPVVAVTMANLAYEMIERGEY